MNTYYKTCKYLYKSNSILALKYYFAYDASFNDAYFTLMPFHK